MPPARTVKLPTVDTGSPVPRYVQAKMILADAIRNGDFAPGSKLPNTGEISAQIKVSLITAHKAIQCLVEEGWVRRERGRGTFVRGDYVASVAAKPQFRVGLVLHPSNPLGDFYHGALITGIRQAAELTQPIGELVIQRSASLREIATSDADGFLCFHPERSRFDALTEIDKERPVLVLGGSLAGTTLNCVDSQNNEGTRAVIRHLIHLGHRRIAIVNGPLESTNCLHRFEGYLAELHAQGIAPSNELIFNAELAKAAGAVMGRLIQTLKGPHRPTAIMAAGYYLALEVLPLLQELKLRVPDDISLVGFDDTKSAPFLNPPLTTVQQPLERMGLRAYQRMVQLIMDRKQPPEIELLPTTLVLRASTASLR